MKLLTVPSLKLLVVATHTYVLSSFLPMVHSVEDGQSDCLTTQLFRRVATLTAEMEEVKQELHKVRTETVKMMLMKRQTSGFINVSPQDRSCTAETTGLVYMDTKYEQIMVCNEYQWKAAELKVPIAGSCQQLYNLGYTKSGIYSLRGDKNLTSYSYKTYCDMNGGWTLIMKINGSDTKLGYDDPLWNNTETLNPDALEDEQSAKLASYWTLPFTELRLGMKDKEITNWITVPYNASSLYDVIADGQYRELTLGRDVWKSLIFNSSLQRNCNKEGFNSDVEERHAGNQNLHAVRIGILGNDQDDCISPDSRLGFGGTGSECVGNENAPVNTCGNIAACGSDNGDVHIPVIGYIMAR